MIGKKKKAVAVSGATERDYDLLLSPVITEKSTAASERNQVVFRVRLDANKTQIKRAVETLFGVKVKAVNTLVRQGKQKRFRQTVGKQVDVKRAVVTLMPGQTIDLPGGLK